eukprot:g43154.t1
MFDVRSGPVMYEVPVGAMVLNKQVDHMKAANSQKVWGQNMSISVTGFPTAPEPVGSPPSRIEDASDSKVNVADVAILMPLPLEEENEFLPRHSGCKMRATASYRPSVSEAELGEPDP